MYTQLRIDRVPTCLPTFVTKWVDYSGKYGLAYQLSNSLAGMYFNDSSSITISSEMQTFDYRSATGKPTIGTIGQHPAELEKKVKLALRYNGYMTDNLHSLENPTTCTDIGSPRVFVADFRRATNAVLFRLSDNVVQVTLRKMNLTQINFADHSKVVLWDSARAVRYVDKRGDVHIWSLADAVTKGSKGEVIERLKTIAKELFTWGDSMVAGKGCRT